MNMTLPVLCRYILLVVIVVAIVLFATANNKGHWVTTDLKDLSPDLVKNDDVNQVISSLSSHIEGQFLLVLSGTDEASLVQAEAQVRNSLMSQPTLMAPIDSEQLLEALLGLLKEHRFHLLTPSQQVALTSNDDKQLLVDAKQSLYRSMGARLAPITEDPFNFFTHYINVLLEGNLLPGGVLQTNEGQWFSVVAVNVVGPALKMDKQAAIASAINQLEAKLAKNAVSLYRSGIIFFADQAAANTQADIKRITTVSIISVVLLLMFIFSSVVPLLLASLSIAVGVILAALLSFTLFGSVHIITLLFGASLIGVVVDYALHYFYHYNPMQTNTSLYKAMGLSLLTSVIGYSALAFSDLLSLQRVAVFSAIGLVTAWLTVVALGPVVLSKPLSVNSRLMDTCLSLLDKFVGVCIKPFIVVLAPLIVIAFIGLCLVGIQHNDEPRLFFSPSSELLSQEKVVANLANDYEPGRYVIIKGSSVDEVYEYLQQVHSVGDTLYSINNWLPSPAEQRKAYALNSKLYSTNGLAKQFYQSIGANNGAAAKLHSQYQSANSPITPSQLMALANKVLPPFWFTVGNSHYSLVRIPKGFNIEPLIAMANDNIIMIDTIEMASTALAEQRASAATLLLIAYALVALLLLVIYRHWRALLLVIAPAVSTMVTLLLFALLNQPMTLFHYMALFLVLGLGMDYMIFAEDMARNNTIRQLTLQAIVLSAITSLLSFGLLGASSLAVVAGFGLTLFVGNLVNVIMAITYSQYYREST